MNKPEEIFFIGYTEGFADPWIIGIDWGESLETISLSDNPSHPQGVFGRVDGDYTIDIPQLLWEDLPETLQKFLINYIKE
mgnify:CR=1 FL=1